MTIVHTIDRYQRVDEYDHLDKRSLIERLVEAGCADVRSSTQKHVLVKQQQQKIDRGLVFSTKCTDEELERFVRDRKLCAPLIMIHPDDQSMRRD